MFAFLFSANTVDNIFPAKAHETNGCHRSTARAQLGALSSYQGAVVDPLCCQLLIFGSTGRGGVKKQVAGRVVVVYFGPSIALGVRARERTEAEREAGRGSLKRDIFTSFSFPQRCFFVLADLMRGHPFAALL